MSDLISRSALIEEIKSLSIILNGKQIFSDDTKDSVLMTIDEQPTAYDIDKVVEELEEMKTIKGSMKTATCRKFDCVTINRAIEIVKQGGVGKEVD